MSPKEVVIAFWEAMQSNDFNKASECLSEDFKGLWPQSSELIVGRKNFAAINSNYPSHGLWEFDIHSVVCEGDTVVTDVSLTDGVQTARAINFHTVENDLIRKQVEVLARRLSSSGMAFAMGYADVMRRLTAVRIKHCTTVFCAGKKTVFF